MSLMLSLLLAAAQPASVPVLNDAKPLASPAVERAAALKVVDELGAVISGRPGQKRDWTRFRGLFTPDARVQVITRRGLVGGSVEDYVSRNGPGLEKEGFSERALVSRIEIFGQLAHVWSSYELKNAVGSDVRHGINSFQLVRQPDGRWLIQNLVWQQARPDLPLPADMERR